MRRLHVKRAEVWSSGLMLSYEGLLLVTLTKRKSSSESSGTELTRFRVKHNVSGTGGKLCIIFSLLKQNDFVKCSLICNKSKTFHIFVPL